MKRSYRCDCFFSHNIFLTEYTAHVKYCNERQFGQDYDKVLTSKGMKLKDRPSVLASVHSEIQRRQALDHTVSERIAWVRESYTPRHPEVCYFTEEWLDPALLDLMKDIDSGGSKQRVVERHLTEVGDEIYMVPALSPDYCTKLVEELDNFNMEVKDKSQPNTMNRYGVMVEEMGLSDFVYSLIYPYLAKIARLLYSEWCGDSGVDSYKSFTIKYSIGEDTDLKYHYDNAEVTFNFCLGTQFEGAEVYFYHMAGETDNGHYCEAEHKPGSVLIHRARHMHGTLPLLSGSRYNLLTWLRSSSIRNELCPMCNSQPVLVEAVRMGDGFTKD